ncbi:hypothetical protein HHA01_05720 [Halomonas halmophila]|uniref:Uncharacterized protein n=2 Tax=Halomonas halmophila TaxID=252 RepID=A0A4Y4EZ17_9GAMM|nr:hypothetical protein HHA01_05720 [Halomonas halmophila]
MDGLRHFLLGALLGAFSWAVCPLVSDQFEPFDTLVGLAAGQALMLAFALYTGCRKKHVLLWWLVAGIYAGQNLYAYAFGSSGTREWFLLGLVTSVLLCILPLVGGSLAKWVSSCSQHDKK